MGYTMDIKVDEIKQTAIMQSVAYVLRHDRPITHAQFMARLKAATRNVADVSENDINRAIVQLMWAKIVASW